MFLKKRFGNKVKIDYICSVLILPQKNMAVSLEYELIDFVSFLFVKYSRICIGVAYLFTAKIYVGL